MSDPLGKGKASEAEAAKLISEIQHLIEVKGLDAKLTVNRQYKAAADGCTTCTLCPCMICP